MEAEKFDHGHLQMQALERELEDVETHIKEEGVAIPNTSVPVDRESDDHNASPINQHADPASDSIMEDGANCVNTMTADPVNGGGGGGPIVSNGPTQAEGVDLLSNTLPASDSSQAKEMQPKYTKAIRAPILTAPVVVRQ